MLIDTDDRRMNERGGVSTMATEFHGVPRRVWLLSMHMQVPHGLPFG